MPTFPPAPQAPPPDGADAPPAPPPDGADAPPAPRRNRLLALFSLLVACGSAAVMVVQSTSDVDATQAALFRAPAAIEPVTDLTALPPVGLPLGRRAVPADDGPLLRMPGSVPSMGSGTFTYASGFGGVLGRSGTVRRYQVAVENGAPENANSFALAVDAALGDARSWTGSGRLRLQRVPAGAAHDFTVYLATAQTAGRMCAAAGVNIQVGGRPYTSCRGTGKVILNLDRWRLSVDHFVAAGVPLSVYRTYVVNHEVGHELGRWHETCPRRGQLAPVMLQQTLSLGGCLANPWPFPRNGSPASPAAPAHVPGPPAP